MTLNRNAGCAGIGTTEESEGDVLLDRFEFPNWRRGEPLAPRFLFFVSLLTRQVFYRQIYLFGFSRGAHVARLVASLISLLGLLEPKSTLDLFPRIFYLLCENRDQASEHGRRRHDELEKMLKRIRKRREEQIAASERGFLVRTLGLFETVSSPLSLTST